MPISLNRLATVGEFVEDDYLASNPDVSAAVRRGEFKSGKEHFLKFGMNEQRQLRQASQIPGLRQVKMKRMKPILRDDLPRTKVNGKWNYLSAELFELAGISDTEAVSANGYDSHVLALAEKYQNGLILDCGAGKRDVYFENIINFEIVDYDTTDVLGVGEVLPFKDNSFDAVVSIAVLEHVRDPFRCADEIVRVLKPGGELYCAVPFLQPLHGYPHHYYNMSHQGLAALFEGKLSITKQDVLESTGPIWTLTWMLRRWSEQLPDEFRPEFHSMSVADLLDAPENFLSRDWVASLPKEAQFELASATVLFARKSGVDT